MVVPGLEGEVREKVYLEGFGEVWADTGEPVEIEGLPECLKPNEFEDANPVFGEAEADWATSRLANLDGSILASETKMTAQLKAIESNLKPGIVRLRAARVRFEEWVKPYLADYAKRELAKRNLKADGTPKANPAKSFPMPYAKLAFTNYNQTGVRMPEGGVEVQRSTLAWMKEHFPHAVVPVCSEKVELSNLTKEDEEKLLAFLKGEVTPDEAGFDVCPLVAVLPSEKFEIKTGVK